jgi:hypothetical protein
MLQGYVSDAVQSAFKENALYLAPNALNVCSWSMNPGAMPQVRHGESVLWRTRSEMRLWRNYILPSTSAAASLWSAA